MSWDVYIFSTDPRQTTKDTKPAPLGDAAEVRTKISKSLPGVDWKDPAWGVFDGKGWSIEFNHQTNGVTDCLALHVRGGGDPVGAIVRICKDNGWVALDSATGELLNLETPSTNGWRKFQTYRDQVLKPGPEPQPGPGFVHRHPESVIAVGIIAVFCIVYLWFTRRR